MGSALLILSTEPPVKPVWCVENNWNVHELKDNFFQHSHYRFDLRANPIKRDKLRDTYDGREAKGRKFVITSAEEQKSWLIRKGEENGFKLHEDAMSWLEIDPREDYRFSHRGKQGVLAAVRFRGVLEVVDAEKFKNVVLAGIGSARGLGFGLLLIQPTII